LRGDGVAGWETGFFAEQLVELVALFAVAVEDLEERGLRAGCALGAPELQGLTDELDGFEVEEEVLGPLGCALAYGDELSGLQMRVGECGLALPLQGEG